MRPRDDVEEAESDRGPADEKGQSGTSVHDVVELNLFDRPSCREDEEEEQQGTQRPRAALRSVEGDAQKA